MSSALLASDVDLAVWADRRTDVRLGAGPELLLEGEAHRVMEDLAARDRSGLEALLAADDERIDVSVVDGWSETASAVPAGATEIELFPNLAPAACWADAAQTGNLRPIRRPMRGTSQACRRSITPCYRAAALTRRPGGTSSSCDPS
jgi:hypothetical protein